jgi:MFS family permease
MLVRVRASLAALARVFQHPDLRRLQLAWAGSHIGGWALSVAFAVYAFRADGAYAVGFVGFASWIAAGVASPVTGTLGDKFPRVRVMVVSDVTRAALLLVTGVLIWNDSPSMLIYVLVVVGTVVSSPFRPAQAALVPSLARTPDELTASNVAATTIESVGIFVGPALGGIAVAAFGVEPTVVAAAVLLLVSAVLVSRIREPERGEPNEPSENLFREGIAGFRTIAAEPKLRLLSGLFAAQTFVDGALGVIIVVLALETLDIGASGLGLLNSASGIGGIAGGILAAALVARSRLGTDFGIGIVMWGLPLVLVGLWVNPALAVAAFFVLGVGNTIVDVAGDTLLQRSVDNSVLARTFGAMDGLMLATVALGAVIAPVVIDVFGVRVAAIAFGALLPLLAALTWRSLVRIDDDAAVRADELELLRGVPIFEPLPPPLLESLAARAERRRFLAGETVFRRGDPGDAFYVVDRGELTLSLDGSGPKPLVRGDFFGEIALLRDVPRTGTITAETDAELLALERDDFLSVVTGHGGASAAAAGIVGARLGTAWAGRGSL